MNAGKDTERRNGIGKRQAYQARQDHVPFLTQSSEGLRMGRASLILLHLLSHLSGLWISKHKPAQ